MNKINPIKINAAAKEISSKKEIIKETAQETVQEIKTQATNLGRDLVNTAAKDSPNISRIELLQEGYRAGSLGVLYKVDHQKDIYNAIQYDKNGVKNITISGSIINGRSIVTQKLGNEWMSIVNDQTVKCNKLVNTSERAARKATELQYEGYSISAQDEKSLTLVKDNLTVNIAKSNGKEIK